MRLLLPLLAFLAVAGCQRASDPEPAAEPAPAAPPPATAEAPAADPGATPAVADVTVYVTEWCPYCRQAQAYLDAEGVPYTAVDIEESAEAYAAYEAAGGTGGIPLIVVGRTVMEGYSEPALAGTLAAAGLSPANRVTQP